MKRVDEMTREELLALTEDGIQTLIDLECAYMGVPLLPVAPVEPKKPDVEPDVTVYYVAGEYFVDKADAQRVAELIGECPRYKYTYAYGLYDGKIVRGTETTMLTVITEKWMSERLYNQHRQALEMYGEARKQYDADRKKYDQILRDRQAIADEVLQKVNEARDWENTVQWIIEQYNRYLKLAEGNQVVAMRFLVKAHAPSKTVLAEVANRLGLYATPGMVEEFFSAEENDA